MLAIALFVTPIGLLFAILAHRFIVWGKIEVQQNDLGEYRAFKHTFWFGKEYISTHRDFTSVRNFIKIFRGPGAKEELQEAIRGAIERQLQEKRKKKWRPVRKSRTYDLDAEIDRLAEEIGLF